MAQNSFMLKGWAITLIVGIFTLLAKDVDERYALVLFFPIVFFWGIRFILSFAGKIVPLFISESSAVNRRRNRFFIVCYTKRVFE